MFYTHFSLNNLYKDRRIYLKQRKSHGQELQPDYQEIEWYTKSDFFLILVTLKNTIKPTYETKHLGTKRNDKNKVDIPDRIRTGRATIYSLLGAGLHVRRGFSPAVAHKLWRTYAIPRCIYGLEIMSLTNKDHEMLELAQRKILRQLQRLPNNTANIAVYVMIGAEPIQITREKPPDLLYEYSKEQ